MPTADDLFRPTGETEDTEEPAAPVRSVQAVPAEEAGSAAEASAKARRPSGRVRHDEKITVYLTAEEMLDIEHARLALRRDQGLAVDRGRLVREAISIVLADLERDGSDSELVRRLLG